VARDEGAGTGIGFLARLDLGMRTYPGAGVVLLSSPSYFDMSAYTVWTSYSCYQDTKQQVYAHVSRIGQLVIPAAIREKFGIKAGRRVKFVEDGTRRVLEPETLAAKRKRIEQLRSMTAGGPSMTDSRLEDHRKERDGGLAEKRAGKAE
jgi:AbrB family looped-hinge helix DNA binding protein